MSSRIGPSLFQAPRWSRSKIRKRAPHRPLSQVARVLFSLCSFNTSSLYYLRAWHRLYWTHNGVTLCTLTSHRTLITGSVISTKKGYPLLIMSRHIPNMIDAWAFADQCYELSTSKMDIQKVSLTDGNLTRAGEK